MSGWMEHPRWARFEGLMLDKYKDISRCMSSLSDGEVSLPKTHTFEHNVWTRYAYVKAMRRDLSLKALIDDAHYEVVMSALRRWMETVDAIDHYISSFRVLDIKEPLANLENCLYAQGRAIYVLEKHTRRSR